MPPLPKSLSPREVSLSAIGSSCYTIITYLVTFPCPFERLWLMGGAQ